jgi:methanogenic corrinoid protein MtbC1
MAAAIEEIRNEYYEAIFDTDKVRALKVIHDALKNGISPEDIVFKVVIMSIESMIQTVSTAVQANLAQHFMTSLIAEEVIEELIPRFEKKPGVTGCVVIGTSQGDFHGLGKRIVIGCLKAYMVNVIDLGQSVSPENFVEEAIVHNAQVIAISSMMVHTARGENGCLKVREILNSKKLDDRIKIIVGGAPYRFDHNLYKVVKADAWAEDGIAAAKIIIELIKGVEK